MPTTPNRDYPYPTLGDDNNPPADLQALALAIEDDLDSLHSQVANAGALPGSGDFIGQRVLLLDTMETAAWTGVEWTGFWKAYAPVWGGLTTNPVIGNGTLSGRFRRTGRTVDFKVQLIGGTTTTWGAGSYTLSLPYARSSAGREVFQGIARDVSDPGSYPIWADTDATLSASTLILRSAATTAGDKFRNVLPTIPFTWDDPDELTLAGTYEAAV